MATLTKPVTGGQSSRWFDIRERSSDRISRAFILRIFYGYSTWPTFFSTRRLWAGDSSKRKVVHARLITSGVRPTKSVTRLAPVISPWGGGGASKLRRNKTFEFTVRLHDF